MKIRFYTVALGLIAGILIMLFSVFCAESQLIRVNLKVKIVQVQKKFNRLQVRVHDGGNRNVQYVEIDGNTRFSHRDDIIPYEQAWKAFRKDMIIRVVGGYTMDFHVKAKEIYW